MVVIFVVLVVLPAVHVVIVIIVMSIFIGPIVIMSISMTFLMELIEHIAHSSTYITLGLVVWSISTRLAGRTYFSLKPRSHRGLASSNVHQAIAGFTF